MTSTLARRRSRLMVGLVPILLVAGALPLMAPTCGSPGEGYKTFSRQSLIIPMDACYQNQSDGTKTYTAVACPQAVSAGNVIKAYGVVYELVRAGVPVYWIIDPGKNQPAAGNYGVTGADLGIQYASGAPALLYNWSNGGQGAAPTAQPTIYYRGGPFVVDGSDYARASAVLQQIKNSGATTLANTPFSSVKIHVSNVAFKAYAKRTMAGGWSAGGAVPPKVALLDIGSSGAGAKNSEFVIQGYLAQAGLDTPPCSASNPSCAGGTTAGPHGMIYDTLFMSDFISPDGIPTHAPLFTNGYQILWVPHWTAPSSCAVCPAGASCNQTNCDNSRYDPVTIGSALKTIAAFSASGHDVFAECAGMGSFEGAFSSALPSTSSYSAVYNVGSAANTTTNFQTSGPSGVWIETNTPSGAVLRGPFNSPFLQLGDYGFTPASGAISDWRAAHYTAPVDPQLVDSTIRMITETATDASYDLFTVRPGAGSHGTVVYLGGHSYSGNDGTFQIAGTRLVLNTLFNLGATCVASNLPCNTGLFGICSQGVWGCNAAGQPTCIQTVFPQPEVCNGLDDNCNGAVDENLTVSCYSTPPDPRTRWPLPAGYVDPLGRVTYDAFMATSTVGSCSPGVSSCVANPDGSYGMSACVGEVLPEPESCNGRDDDCNGVTDDAAGQPLAATCYTGPSYSVDASGNPVGQCKAGTWYCQGGSFGAPVGAGFVPGACQGEVLPQPEVCGGPALDLNCDGTLTTCGCTTGTTRPCFTGPGAAGVGACQLGQQVCAGALWGAYDPEVPTSFIVGACGGQVTAQATEPCIAPPLSPTDPNFVVTSGNAAYVAAADVNCDGKLSHCPQCTGTQSESCWGSWGASDGAGAKPPEAGVGQCALGTRTCNHGTWGSCIGYGIASAIEYCDGLDNTCNNQVDENAVCPAGATCLRGVCVPAACGVERPAPEGYVCCTGAGTPVAGCTAAGMLASSSCGSAAAPGCAVGALCELGTCVNPCPTAWDPVTSTTVSTVCAQPTVCGGGACIAGGCYEQGCPDPAKPLCLGGQCLADPCAGQFCPSGTFCRRSDLNPAQADCVQACAFMKCSVGQKCGVDGFCEADPCANAACKVGEKCVTGACVADPCTGLACASGQVCDDVDGRATCVDDPCVGIDCPAGVCIRGQCYATGNPTGSGTVPAESSSSSGCHCGSGSGVALPALLALLAAPLLRRRRRGGAPGAPGGTLALLLVGVVLVAAGCKDKSSDEGTTFDPTKCAATCGEQRCVDLLSDPAHCGACQTICGASEQCVDSVCGPTSAVAPFVASVSPSTASKDQRAVALVLSGARFEENATVRMSTPLGARTVTCPATSGGDCRFVSASELDLTVDLTDVGTSPPFTLRVVNPNKVISNAVTLTVQIPIPGIAAPNPPYSVLAGTITTVLVNPAVPPGSFTSLSECHLSTTPPSGTTPGANDMPLQTSFGWSAPDASGVEQLQCVVDATALADGVYDLSVLSEAGRFSNAVGLTVTPSAPVVYSVAPLSGAPGTTVNLTVTGDRFGTTSKIVFGSTVITGTLFGDSSHLYATGFTLPGCAGASCPFGVSVQTGATSSNAVNFTVGSNPPTINSFSPAIAYQGDTVNLVFVGTNFPPNSGIELQRPGSGTFDPLASTTSGCGGGVCTQVSASKSFLVSAGAPCLAGRLEPEGTWNARIRLGPAGSPTTPSWPLRLLSSQAVLRNYAATPTPAQSGQVDTTSPKTKFTFQVSNLHPAPGAGTPAATQVHGCFTDPDFPNSILAALDPTIVVTTGTLAFDATPPSTLLNGLTAGVYQFTVQNPNAAPSNGLTFNVTPGPPRIQSVCLAGTSCTNVTKQLPPPAGTVTITLTGANFAFPDASGNNGSTVWVAADFMPGWDPNGAPTFACSGSGGVQPQAVPGTVTVRSSSRIDVLLDTQNAYVDPSFGTTYYVAVYNPSGTGPPLKSGAPNLTCTASPGAPSIDPRTMPWFKVIPGP